jgi:flagellar basal body rod protein FlgG
MKVIGGIRYTERGVTTSLRAMHLQSEIMAMRNENVTGFDKVGFQRKEPVVSSMTEWIGIHGLSQTVDDKVGRIAMSSQPLDCALANRGYFAIQTQEGVELTRDGRFKYDKYGNLLNTVDNPVLSDAGIPIKLPVVPTKPDEIKIDANGNVTVYDPKTNKMAFAGRLGVVDSNGALVIDPQVKQGYNEFSNVSMQEEFLTMLPAIRNFEANRQIFMIQNQNLQKVISQLGSSQ